MLSAMKKALALTLVAGAALTACAPDGDDPSTWSDTRQLNWIEDDPYYRERGATEDPVELQAAGREWCEAIEENYDGDYQNFIEWSEQSEEASRGELPDLAFGDPVEDYMVFEHYIAVNLECPEYAEDFYGWTDAEPQGT